LETFLCDIETSRRREFSCNMLYNRIPRFGYAQYDLGVLNALQTDYDHAVSALQ
jgi:hypothetical protein